MSAHTFTKYSMLSVPESHAVLCDMVNRDIAVWVSEFMRAAQRSSPAVVPSSAGTVFDRPPMSAFVRTLEFCRGGGGVLRLVLSSIGSGAGRPTKRKATASPLGRPGPRERAVQVSLRPAGCSRAPVNATGLRRVCPCTRTPQPLHPRHLRLLAGRKAVEAWRRRAEGRGRCRCFRPSPRGATEGAREVEALVLVLDEDTALPPGGANLLRAQVRRRRWI